MSIGSKSFGLLGFLSVLLAGCLPESSARNLPVVEDASLQACLNAALGDSQSATDLTQLSCQGKGVQSLNGLSAYQNLAYLNVSENQIQDVSELIQLPLLHTLELQDNQISDVTELSELNHLTFVDIRNNPVDQTQVIFDFSVQTHIETNQGCFVNATLLSQSVSAASIPAFFSNLCQLVSEQTPSFAIPPTSVESTSLFQWQPLRFPDAGIYQNKCAIPRTGIDPHTNAIYPDLPGNETMEKLYLRSFSHETYLWFDELPDPDPAPYNVANYFNTLKTDAITNSGRAKDQFHFTQSYEDYQNQSQQGASVGFGFHWQAVSNRVPLNYVIQYVDEQSPAGLAGVARGDRLMNINDINFVSPTSISDYFTINQVLFSPSADQSVRFTFETPQGSTKIVDLEAGTYPLSSVMNVKVFDRSNGEKVGYFQLNQFTETAQQGLIDAFNDEFIVENINELVIDLRYNGGGLLYQSAQLGFMVAGDASRDRIFENMVYNSERTEDNFPLAFQTQPIDWDNQVFLNSTLPYLNLSRVFVLTTGATASASESLINGLRGIDVEVVQIGSQTRGKPYGFLPQQNCGTMYYTIQFRGENAKGFGDYADGLIPTENATGEMGLNANVLGCVVADDLTEQQGDENEGMLAAALTFLDSGNCPAVNVSPAQNNNRAESNRFFNLTNPHKNHMIDNKIFTPIN